MRLLGIRAEVAAAAAIMGNACRIIVAVSRAVRDCKREFVMPRTSYDSSFQALSARGRVRQYVSPWVGVGGETDAIPVHSFFFPHCRKQSATANEPLYP